MEYQVRISRLRPGTAAPFLEAWLAGVYPLRKRFGFSFHGVWLAGDRQTFIWVLGYDGPGSFEDADAAYYASAERAALDPDPAQYIEASEHHMAHPVLSPATTDAHPGG